MIKAEQIIEITLTELPHFEVKETPPVISTEEYESRLIRAREKMQERNLTHLVIYADREYFSNVEFFTGFDPRFEEALFIIEEEGLPTLVVGNEGLWYAEACLPELKLELYQDFSLQGQPRSKSKTLEQIFTQTGIKKNSKVGVIGLKYYGAGRAEDKYIIDIPVYIVDVLRTMAGKENVTNTTDIMKDPEAGLRAVGLSSTEIVLAEIASAEVSLGLENFLTNFCVGMTEMEASKLLKLDGSPLPVHPNVNFGEKNVLLGVASPTYTQRAICDVAKHR